MVLATTLARSTSPFGLFDHDDADKKEILKAQLCLDGLEPYVLVSAITSTASFSVLTQGNVFADGTIWSADGTQASWIKIMTVITSSSSSILGLYALGVFSFCILYSKAALGRVDELHIYKQFYDATARYRYRGYISFVVSLILFVANVFLFALMYLPEHIQGYAAIGAVAPFFLILMDWSDIICTAKMIYQKEDNSPLKTVA
jgi:hypothetical protein